jgi:hypothetical protein
MGIRDYANQHRGAAIGVASGMIVVAVVVAVLSTRDGASAENGMTAKSFFSNDDGKTWFADNATMIPPFTKDGKEAHRAYVYRAPDGTEFVAYLEKYTPAGKRAVEAALARPPEEQFDTDPYLADGAGDAVLVKKPGANAWINSADPRAAPVLSIVSPKGETETLTFVSPN